LTTAATIWVTAALGMGVATGHYYFVFIATAMVLLSLFILIKLEYWMDKISQYRTYKIVFPYRKNVLEDYESIMKNHRLSSKRTAQEKDGPNIIMHWTVRGKEKDHLAFTDHLMQDEYVRRYEV
jgi:putative Mg2+ transporter-C (MgtC) family protein